MNVVSEEEFPYGVRCMECQTEILPGESYRLRDFTQSWLTDGGVITEGKELICVAC